MHNAIIYIYMYLFIYIISDISVYVQICVAGILCGLRRPSGDFLHILDLDAQRGTALPRPWPTGATELRRPAVNHGGSQGPHPRALEGSKKMEPPILDSKTPIV